PGNSLRLHGALTTAGASDASIIAILGRRLSGRRSRSGRLRQQLQLREQGDLVVVDLAADDPTVGVEVPHLADRQRPLLAGGRERSEWAVVVPRPVNRATTISPPSVYRASVTWQSEEAWIHPSRKSCVN